MDQGTVLMQCTRVRHIKRVHMDLGSYYPAPLYTHTRKNARALLRVKTFFILYIILPWFGPDASLFLNRTFIPSFLFSSSPRVARYLYLFGLSLFGSAHKRSYSPSSNSPMPGLPLFGSAHKCSCRPSSNSLVPVP
jgi:hypothetical protein